MRDMLLLQSSIDDLRRLKSQVGDLIDLASFAGFLGIDARFDKAPGQDMVMFLYPGETYDARHRPLDLGEAVRPVDEAEGPNDPAPARDDAPYAWSPETGIEPIPTGVLSLPGDTVVFPDEPVELGPIEAGTLHFTSTIPSPLSEPADDAPPVVAAAAAGGVAPQDEPDDEPDQDPDAPPPPGAEGQAAAIPPPVAAGETVAGMPEQTADHTAGAAAADSGGEAGVAAPDLPAAPIAASVNSGGMWTEEEEARVVEIVAQSWATDAPKKEGIRLAVEAVGRAIPAMENRVYSKLKARIDARVRELCQPKSAAPPPAEITPAIRRHLASLSRITHGRRWTEAEDISVLEAALQGMKLAEIAADMGIDASKVKHRLEVLGRSHDMLDVLDALKAGAV
jgi:hypothetical protein